MVAHNIPSRALAACFAALLAGASTAPLQAQPPQQPVTVFGHSESPLTRVVPIGDLAIATSAGRKVMMYRVSVAVDQVCPESEAGRSYYEPAYDVEDCKAFAWAGADRQIRHAVDLARSGQAVAMAIEVTSAGS